MAQHDHRGGHIVVHNAGGGGGGGGNTGDIIQSIPVPADRIGWVIGKEGSFIKQVEERSKAAVRISDSSIREYGREWKYVQLQGTPRAVDRAKKLLHIRLERLLQRLFSTEEGSAPSSPTAPAAAATGPMLPAAAGADDAVKDEKPVKAIEESGGAAAAAAAAAATVPSVAAAVAATAAAAVAMKPEVSLKPEV